MPMVVASARNEQRSDGRARAAPGRVTHRQSVAVDAPSDEFIDAKHYAVDAQLVASVPDLKPHVGRPAFLLTSGRKARLAVLLGTETVGAVLHFEAALEAIQWLGHESSPSKEQPPWPTAGRPRGGVSLDSLGVEFDLELDRMRLMPAKPPPSRSLTPGH